MIDRPSRFAAFIAELRHRRVFRVAVVYACVAFIIFQIIDATFDYMPIPDWVGTAFIVVLLLCFPITVALAWAFDLTAEGLVRAKPEREPAAAKTPHHVIIGNKTLAIVAALAVIAAAWSWWGRPAKEAEVVVETGLGERSIAVLPFVNFSDSKDDEYFSDGITDDILTHLSKIGDLRVIGRTSVMQYKNTTKRLRDIGRELGVATLLEGSVRRADSRVRITSQLVDAKTEEHLWAETYDRDLTDIFAIQSDVAQQIAAALKATLTSEEKGYIERKPTDNLEAYDYYLQGNNYFYRMWLGYSAEESLDKAVEMYRKAVELDPGFALAWARLCRSHLRIYGYSPFRSDPSQERLGRARESLDKALALDPSHPEVLMAHGYYYYWGHANYPQAGEYFRQALVKAPNNSEILTTVGIVQRRLGELEASLPYLEKAYQLDPRHFDRLTNLSISLVRLRRWEEAEHYADIMIQLEPKPIGYNRKITITLRSSGDIRKMREVVEQAKSNGFDMRGQEIALNIYEGNYEKALEIYSSYKGLSGSEHLGLANLHTLMERPRQAAAHYDSARINYERLVTEDPDFYYYQVYLGQAYAGLGRREEALRQGQLATTRWSLEKDAQRGQRVLIYVLQIFILLEEYDQALDQLELLLSIPSDISVHEVRLDPLYKPIREQPRFKALLEQYGG